MRPHPSGLLISKGRVEVATWTQLRSEVERLHVVNAALLAACKAAEQFILEDSSDYPDAGTEAIANQLRAAIAAAEGE